MLEPLNFLSVCSGIEAASVAWEPLGWRASAVSEIEPFPCHVLAHRWGAGRPLFMPNPEAPGLSLKDRRGRAAAIKAMATVPEGGRIPNLGDMTQFKEWPEFGTTQLLVGGTPCQSFSVAGLRKGLDDPRGNLALTYLALADRYRPEWVVWENVPGVLSSNGGRDFGAFLGGLVQLGYGFAYRVLDAQYIRTFSLPWAVPQRRRRVFVVGYLGDWRPAAAVLFDGQSLRGDPPPRREAGKGVAETLTSSLGRRGGLPSGGEVDGHLIVGGGPDGGRISGTVSSKWAKGSGGPAGDEVYNMVAVSPTLRAGGNHTGGDRPPGTDVDTCDSLIPVAHSLRGDGFDASEDGTGRGTPIVPVAFDSKASQPQDVEDGSSPTLRAMNHSGSHANAGGQLAVAFDAQAGGNTGLAHSSEVAGALHGGGKHGGRAAVAFAENSRAELRLCGGDGQVSSQLTTGGGKPGQGQPCVASRWAVRRLTPKECERLQGFSDGYTDVPYRGRNHTPDGPRYKALGNSMACNAMEWIGQRIQHVREAMAESGKD